MLCLTRTSSGRRLKSLTTPLENIWCSWPFELICLPRKRIYVRAGKSRHGMVHPTWIEVPQVGPHGGKRRREPTRAGK